ncbi:MAG: hypothetical protein JWM05_207, partial [Acidimicrobiales bacterium]|nr:hypothetical protein [Acidimicrobiales bacterium]
RLVLAPGRYELTAERTARLSCEIQPATLAAGRTIEITLRCDTGIR